MAAQYPIIELMWFLLTGADDGGATRYSVFIGLTVPLQSVAELRPLGNIGTHTEGLGMEGKIRRRDSLHAKVLKMKKDDWVRLSSGEIRKTIVTLSMEGELVFYFYLRGTPYRGVYVSPVTTRSAPYSFGWDERAIVDVYPDSRLRRGIYRLELAWTAAKRKIRGMPALPRRRKMIYGLPPELAETESERDAAIFKEISNSPPTGETGPRNGGA